MSELTIALLQIAAVPDDPRANLERGVAACREAKALGADIALFPEMWSTGYSFERRPGAGDLWRAPGLWVDGETRLTDAERTAIQRLISLATSADGPWVGTFRQAAIELNMAIAITYLEAAPAAAAQSGRSPGARNSVSLIDRHGSVAFTYAKVHTCAFDLPEAALDPGEAFRVATIDTAAGPVTLGAMICFDREFPESARVLMLGGAEVILTPNACQLDDWRLAEFSTRAIENAVGVAMTNYPAPKENGISCAYSPMVFGPDGEPINNELVRAGANEGIVLARFDLDALRDYRKRETFGNAFRRPSRYQAIASTVEPGPPFLRVSIDGARYEPDGRAASVSW